MLIAMLLSLFTFMESCYIYFEFGTRYCRWWGFSQNLSSHLYHFWGWKCSAFYSFV